MKFFSSEIKPDLKAILLPYDQYTNIRSEADFYGASQIVSEYIGLKKTPNSFSSWSHGVHYQKLKYIEQVIWKQDWVKNRLVANERVETFLKRSGVDKVKAVGLPIVYVPAQNILRQQNSVLFMLAHTLSYVQFDHNLEEIIEQCRELQKQGRYICFCVHLDCFLQGKVTRELDKHNIDWFVGSSVKDINSLKRMRRAFEYFEVVASNTMGSHFFYAQLFGAKFYFLEPYFEYEIKHFKKAPVNYVQSKRLAHGRLESSKRTIMKRFPEYFVGYEYSLCNTELAEVACGVACKAEPEVINRLLGWDLKNQVCYFLPYYGSKFKQKINKKVFNKGFGN